MEKIELDPFTGVAGGLAVPPPPTVIGKAVAVNVIPVGVAKGLAVYEPETGVEWEVILMYQIIFQLQAVVI